MKNNLLVIKTAFSGRLIGKSIMKTKVSRAVSLLPDDLVDFVTKNVWFLASPDDAWGFTFRGSDIQNQYLIVLSDELFMQPNRQIMFTILHEIGHVVLGHRNSMRFKQSASEIRTQEISANAFAGKYLKDI
jgi:Zn-dependent protease with chaperone function